jgi:hypothetical protein
VEARVAVWILVGLSVVTVVVLLAQLRLLRRASRNFAVVAPDGSLTELPQSPVLPPSASGTKLLPASGPTAVEVLPGNADTSISRDRRLEPPLQIARALQATGKPVGNLATTLSVVTAVVAVIGALGTWIGVVHNWDPKTSAASTTNLGFQPTTSTEPPTSSTVSPTTTTTVPPTTTTTVPRTPTTRAPHYVGLTGQSVPSQGAASQSDWAAETFNLGSFQVSGYSSNCCVDANVVGGPGRQTSFDVSNLTGYRVIAGLLNGQTGSAQIKVQFDTDPITMYIATTGHPQSVLIAGKSTVTVTFVGGGDSPPKVGVGFLVPT